MLRASLILAALLALSLPSTAQAGFFTAQNGVITYTAADGETDQIAGFDIGDQIRFTRFGGAAIGPGAGCDSSDDFQTIDCPEAGITAIVLVLGDGDDVAAVSASITLPVTFFGGPGDDGLFGGGGLDSFFGQGDNDNIVARDGRAEQVDCGDGTDTAISDDADTRVSCERVQDDADGDGVQFPADCDDTKPNVRPGAADVPDNGIDEDCSGADSVVADRDRDGTPRPQDCNDGDAAIRPGLPEVIGNEVDENCDGRVDPFPPITGGLAHTWDRRGSGTVNLRLLARRFPTNTAIEMRCSGRGCPFSVVRRRVQRRGQTINLHGSFRNRALRRGTEIEVRVTIANRIGRVMRYTIGRPGDAPDVEFLCLPPGGRPAGC